MFLAPKNVEERLRLYESDTPILAFAFHRQAGWAARISERCDPGPQTLGNPSTQIFLRVATAAVMAASL